MPQNMLIILIACVFIVLVIVILLFTNYNAFQRIRVHVDKTASDIKVLLKQRFDEIPQLVSVCKQFMKKETDLFEKLAELRTQFEKKNDQPSSTDDLSMIYELDHSLNDSLKSLTVMAETYPELQSAKQFLHLQHRISSLETQITQRREYYNESVALYNSRLMMFPVVLFRIFFSYKKKSFLEISVDEHHVPSLDFS